MKKESLIILFYVLYFTWLFAITYLTQRISTLNYYTLFIAAFYLIFLREKGDWFWFIVGNLVSVVLSAFSFNNFHIKFDFSSIALIPIWLPIAWGTTFVALRRFVLLLEL